jgi:hypothetical protein
MLQQDNHKGITLVIHCKERVALRIGTDEVKVLP